MEHISDGWREAVYPSYFDTQWFSWSSNSRYGVVLFTNHYGVMNLAVFDTHEWLWHFATSCDAVAGSMSPCPARSPTGDQRPFPAAC
ncbi:MAG: hypothetical protein U0694_03465 [Anaerolineae bacterium]